MKHAGGVKLQLHVSLPSWLHGREWLASRLSRFPPGEGAPATDWRGLRAAVDGIRTRGRPAHSLVLTCRINAGK